MQSRPLCLRTSTWIRQCFHTHIFLPCLWHQHYLRQHEQNLFRSGSSRHLEQMFLMQTLSADLMIRYWVFQHYHWSGSAWFTREIQVATFSSRRNYDDVSKLVPDAPVSTQANHPILDLFLLTKKQISLNLQKISDVTRARGVKFKLNVRVKKL